ncbi:MAG TPA: hypothetical protein VM056_05270 [Terriglobales bacterium]|nr:hypothetical protein [Terriglobales bacterium]
MAFLLASCGGGSSNAAPGNPAPIPTNTGSGGTNTPVPVQPVRAVTVGAGQAVGGIDIAVSNPVNSAGANAEVLGVSELNSAGRAFGSGASIRRGSSMRVILFGRALNGGLRVTIGGPADITVSNVRTITATDGTAGVAFDATVAPAAALGARTVILRSDNDDITTFTGGLEVVQ